ncbi:MAG: TonB-dependent receptor, partial [Roseibium sp.]|uniref:TonB-dependent receptor n=1 Tax=Roseibium sp. TaxID=1936156 RepID=UPI0026290A68
MSTLLALIEANSATTTIVSYARSFLLSFIFSATFVTGTLASSRTFAETAPCATPECSKHIRDNTADDKLAEAPMAGEFIRQEMSLDEGTIPFSISVDGEVVDSSGQRKPTTFGSTPSAKPVDQQRKSDVDLSAVDIQIKFDGLEQRSILNITTTPVRRAYRAGEKVSFLATSNYPAFISRAEIRITATTGTDAGKLVDVIPVIVNGEGWWTMPAGEDREFSYVLRVYDAKGRFDETHALTLARTSRDYQLAARETAVAPGMAQDRTAIRGIPVHGGAVTVFGRDVPPDYRIEAFGEHIPLDPDRSFVAQRILPPGDHDVQVAVKGPAKTGSLNFNRNINIPDNDWFYVALADLTVGKRIGDNQIETVRAGEYGSIYTKGRLAFYLKGKIKGKYLLTAAADTGEDDIGNLFRGLDAKDPRQLLRRIDPDDYYPIYGDDSLAIDDAPTSGKFYVRLERGNSHVMWGNYKTRIIGSEFVRADRSLYGANAVYRSEKITSFGEPRTQATAYAAKPDTLPQRDEFLATGGSAYFLKRQDITIGSDTITVEIRDSVTDLVLERRYLSNGEDYSIDYLQGVLLLRQPLFTVTQTTAPVRDGALGGDNIYLIAQYEYTPLFSDLDEYAHGGRVQHWLNDKVRVGATETYDTSSGTGHQVLGADIQLRHSQTTFLQAEVAQSDGSGFGVSRSTDGGLTIFDEPAAGQSSKTSTAWRLSGQFDLEDIGVDDLRGTISGYYENEQAGFSTLTSETAVDRQIWGAQAQLHVADAVRVNLGYDELRDGNGQLKRDGEVGVTWQASEQLRATLGVAHAETRSPLAVSSGKSGYNGSRVDVGTRIAYQPNDDHLLYAFGQSTLHRTDDIDNNNRAGLGGEIQLTEKISASGETSYGSGGLGALAALNYAPTADDTYYLGYRLDPDRTLSLENVSDISGSNAGVLVAGTRRSLSETTSAYGETSYDMFGRRYSLAQTYGVVYTPDALWRVEGDLVTGAVEDDTVDEATGQQNSDFNRYAVSLGVGYNDEEAGIRGRIRGEGRFERSGDETRDLDTYFLTAGLAWNTGQDWRLAADVDAVLSHFDSDAFYGGDYVEASVGYAYRPIDNDRL